MRKSHKPFHLYMFLFEDMLSKHCQYMTIFYPGGQWAQHPTEARLPLQEIEQDDEQGLEEEVRDPVRRRKDHLPSEFARLYGKRAREGNPLAVCHC